MAQFFYLRYVSKARLMTVTSSSYIDSIVPYMTMQLPTNLCSGTSFSSLYSLHHSVCVSKMWEESMRRSLETRAVRTDGR